jgi:methionine aminopeptidase
MIGQHDEASDNPRRLVAIAVNDKPISCRVGHRDKGRMFFTIEPMINLGKPHVKILSDGWDRGDP